MSSLTRLCSLEFSPRLSFYLFQILSGYVRTDHNLLNSDFIQIPLQRKMRSSLLAIAGACAMLVNAQDAKPAIETVEQFQAALEGCLGQCNPGEQDCQQRCISVSSFGSFTHTRSKREGTRIRTLGHEKRETVAGLLWARRRALVLAGFHAAFQRSGAWEFSQQYLDCPFLHFSREIFGYRRLSLSAISSSWSNRPRFKSRRLGPYSRLSTHPINFPLAM